MMTTFGVEVGLGVDVKYDTGAAKVAFCFACGAQAEIINAQIKNKLRIQ
jgi:hypothetical protein